MAAVLYFRADKGSVTAGRPPTSAASVSREGCVDCSAVESFIMAAPTTTTLTGTSQATLAWARAHLCRSPPTTRARVVRVGLRLPELHLKQLVLVGVLALDVGGQLL